MNCTRLSFITAMAAAVLNEACSAPDPNGGPAPAAQVESSVAVALIGGTSSQREKWLGDYSIRFRGSVEEVSERALEATRELARLEKIPGAKLIRLGIEGHEFDLSEAAFPDVRPALQRALVRPLSEPSSCASSGERDLGCAQQALRLTKCCAGLVAYCQDGADELEGRPGCLWCCDE